MKDDNSPHTGEAAARTGANDHSWEREHRHPTPAEARAIGQRRRDAEAKLEQRQQEARHKAAE
jgi:hypothetical protein